MKRKYILNVKIRNNIKGPTYHYYVTEEGDCNIISERKSERKYVACTKSGSYYFGRLDLIGKGDHGRRLKWQAETNREAEEIAYLSEESKAILFPKTL